MGRFEALRMVSPFEPDPEPDEGGEGSGSLRFNVNDKLFDGFREFSGDGERGDLGGDITENGEVGLGAMRCVLHEPRKTKTQTQGECQDKRECTHITHHSP